MPIFRQIKNRNKSSCFLILFFVPYKNERGEHNHKLSIGIKIIVQRINLQYTTIHFLMLHHQKQTTAANKTWSLLANHYIANQHNVYNNQNFLPSIYIFPLFLSYKILYFLLQKMNLFFERLNKLNKNSFVKIFDKI